MPYTQIEIVAAGGTQFRVTLIGDDDTLDQFLGSVEAGEIESDGQWTGDDSDAEDAAREAFDLPTGLPVIVR